MTAMGFSANVYLSVGGKHCRHPIAVMGDVDTFGHGWMPKWWPLHYPDIAIIEEEDFNKVSCIIKAPISLILQYLRLRWLIFGIKAYLLHGGVI